MTTPWIVAFVVLVALNAFLALVVLGLLRRAVSEMEQAQREREALRYGSTADHDDPHEQSYAVVGGTVPPPPGREWSELGDSTVVFLEAGCEGCQLLATDAAVYRKQAASSGQSLLFVVDEPRGPLGRLPAEIPTVIDADRSMWHAWNIHSSPVAYFVSSSGFVVGAHHPHTLQEVLDFKSKVEASQLVQE
jgi:hypothetical protein